MSNHRVFRRGDNLVIEGGEGIEFTCDAAGGANAVSSSVEAAILAQANPVSQDAPYPGNGATGVSYVGGGVLFDQADKTFADSGGLVEWTPFNDGHSTQQIESGPGNSNYHLTDAVLCLRQKTTITVASGTPAKIRFQITSSPSGDDDFDVVVPTTFGANITTAFSLRDVPGFTGDNVFDHPPVSAISIWVVDSGDTFLTADAGEVELSLAAIGVWCGYGLGTPAAPL